MSTVEKPTGKDFTGYHIFMIIILAFLQFTVILDFMVLNPLGVILLKELHLDTTQFGLVVSAYAISACISGLLAAGFADKFDRKKLLMFFYIGFLGGTALCAMASSYESLLMARIVTGLFGGVISSIGFAIVIDLFRVEVRGRVMGFIQMAFSLAQVLGIPVGLVLANQFGWESTFWMIVGVGAIVGVVIAMFMKPITEHLKIKSEKNAFAHLGSTISNPNYLIAFCSTIVLATGGFMVMPFASAYTTGNLGIAQEDLPKLYFVTGVVSFFAGPLIGFFSDKVGKFNIFLVGSILGMVMMLIYCHLGVTPLAHLMVINAVLFIGISSRIIASSTLMSVIPQPQDRGAFMSVNSAVQQFSGGIGAGIAGLIVVKTSNGQLLHYDILGYCVAFTMTISVIMMYFVDKQIKAKAKAKIVVPEEGKVSVEA